MKSEDAFVEALFGESEAEKKTAPKISRIATDELSLFPDHPFKVLDNEEMDVLVESVRENGIMSPLIVRHKEGSTDEYEVISGHRRLFAAKKAGITEVPALIYDIDRDTAAIAVVDSNLHREHILPSEKAFAYKIKTEAMSHRGKQAPSTLGQVVPKQEASRTTAEIGAGSNESYKTVQRYIRLTSLVSEILELVDMGKIAFTPAVEISYLTEEEQYGLLTTIESEDCTPSLEQAQEMKLLSHMTNGKLSDEEILRIMTRQKPNQKEKLKIPLERISGFFPKDYTAKQIEDEIVKLCEARFKRKQRESR